MKRRRHSSSSSLSSEDIPLVKIKNSGYSFVKENILRMPTREQCEICLRFFKNKYNYLVHNSSHIIIPLMKLEFRQCQHCLKYFTSQDDLSNHIIEYHSIADAVKGNIIHSDSIVDKSLDFGPYDDSDKVHNNEDRDMVKACIYVRKDIFDDGSEDLGDVKEEKGFLSTIPPSVPGLSNDVFKDVGKESIAKPEENADCIRNRIVFEDDASALPSNIINDIVNECQDALDIIEPSWLLNNLTQSTNDENEETKSSDGFDILDISDDIDILNVNDLCQQIVADAGYDTSKSKSGPSIQNSAADIQNGATNTRNGAANTQNGAVPQSIAVVAQDGVVLQNNRGLIQNEVGIMQNGAGILRNSSEILPNSANNIQGGAVSSGANLLTSVGVLQNNAVGLSSGNTLQNSGVILANQAKPTLGSNSAILLNSVGGVLQNREPTLSNTEVLHNNLPTSSSTVAVPSINRSNSTILSKLLAQVMAKPNFKSASKVLNNSYTQNGAINIPNTQMNKSVSKSRQTSKTLKPTENTIQISVGDIANHVIVDSIADCVDCQYYRNHCRQHGIGAQLNGAINQQQGATTQEKRAINQQQGATTQHNGVHGQITINSQPRAVNDIQDFHGWLVLQQPGEPVPQLMSVGRSSALQTLQSDLENHQTRLRNLLSGSKIQQNYVQTLLSSSRTQESGSLTQQSGSSTQQNGLLTQQSVSLPQQSGSRTQQSGSRTRQSASLTQQSGLLSPHIGLHFQQNGSIVSLKNIQSKQKSKVKQKQSEIPEWNAVGTIPYGELIKPGIYKCKRCCKIYPNRLKLLKHEPTHITFDRSGPNPCCFCEQYLQEDAMERHCSVHHNGSSRGDDLIPKKCKICGLNAYNWSLHYNLYHNVKNVSKETNYNNVLLICDICFKDVKNSLLEYRVWNLCSGLCMRCGKNGAMKQITNWKKKQLEDRLLSIRKRLKLLNQMNKI